MMGKLKILGEKILRSISILNPLAMTSSDSGKLAVERLSCYRPFDAKNYLLQNPDVALSSTNPYQHYLEFGCQEQRRLCTDPHLATCIGEVAFSPLDENHHPYSGKKLGKVEILCSSKGNSFMQSIASELAIGLQRCGILVSSANEFSKFDSSVDHRIIVAPHEFFYDGRGNAWNSPQIIRKAVMLSTEQIQTKWYTESLPFLLEAKGVIDMYYHSMILLRETGVPALHYVPDPAPISVEQVNPRLHEHPLYKVLPEGAKQNINFNTEYNERPIDVSFFGAESPHRDQILASCAPFMADLESYIYCRRLRMGPLTGEDNILVDLATHVTGHSKICLNIHRDNFGAFEWFRIVQHGMRTGSLVVSEHCLQVPDFIEGEHYIGAHGRHMGEMIEWLVRDPSGQKEASRVRTNAICRLQQAYCSNSGAMNVVNFLKTLA